MSRNPNQAHKKLDPLIRERHKRMVDAFAERQRQEQRTEGLELIVSLVADKISKHPLNEKVIRQELRSLAILFKREGKNRDDFLDACHWMESQLGVKLLPAGKLQ